MPRENRIRRMLRNDVPVLETDCTDEIRKAIREFGIEVLNSHHWHIQRYPISDPTVFADLPRHVATLHGMIEADRGYDVTQDQLRIVDKSIDTWVYTADKNVEPLKSSGLYDEAPKRFVKIPNGMAPPEITPIPREEMGIPENAFVLCNVSRAIPEKGWVETIEAVKKARAISGKDIRLILVGNGVVYDEYSKIGVPDFVYMPGFDKRSVEYYAASDMGIMLSRFRSESFPLTITDCLFAGKPYIASDIGEIRNMLTTDEGMAGAVFKLADWSVPEDEVARKIADFAIDTEKYDQVKARVYEAARRYTIENVSRQYLDVFQAPSNMRKPHEKIEENKNGRDVKKLSFYETNIYQRYKNAKEPFYKKMEGFCPICETKSTFVSNHNWLRDNYRCETCQSIPRQRYLQHTLHSLIPGWQNMLIHESSPCNDFIKRCVTGYTASQFYPGKKPGERVGAFTNENIEALTFSDNTFDIFLSQDVLEHVFNPEKAVREMLRVVKVGGYVMFTIPVFSAKKTLQRARLGEHGNVEYIEDAVYHGNPIDSDGSLAVWDYGKDFIEKLKDWAPDCEVGVFNHPIPEMGIEGEFLDVFYVKKCQAIENKDKSLLVEHDDNDSTVIQGITLNRTPYFYKKPNNLLNNVIAGKKKERDYSAFSRLIWKPDRLLIGDLVFRLEVAKNNNWELGDECFRLYKDKRILGQYDAFWARRKDFNRSHVLELGIFDGGSIAFWWELWKPKRFIGIDLRNQDDSAYFKKWKKSRGLDDCIKTYWRTDQTDAAKLNKIVSEDLDGHLDLIIDDASHMYAQTKRSFELLFPHLRTGGLYIIEDWSWGCNPSLPVEFSLPHGTELPKLIAELNEATGSKPWAMPVEGMTLSDQPLISMIEVFPNFVVLERGPSDSPPGGLSLDSYITRRPAK